MSSQDNKSTINSSVSASASGSAGTGHHQPHHITEFGEVDNLVHIEQDHKHEDDTLPAPHVSRRDSISRKERLNRLRYRLFTSRHIHQYWHGETLYRSSENRVVTPEELFLDLVIVGAIAALGHELRETFLGWKDVEKFFLLFGAVYNSWRSIVFVWNLWGVHGDLVDKVTVYLCFFSLVSIALGAHGAFSPGPRPYVAIASFAASVIPTLLNTFWSYREPLFNSGNDFLNQYIIYTIINILTVTPYFVAAFISNEVVVRVLYWIPLVSSPFGLLTGMYVYRFLNRNCPNRTRLAVSIELTVEKYDTLTMIVLGESVLGVLFEGSAVVTKSDVRLSNLFGAAAAATAMLYSLETLYVNVDSPIARGGKHALRHNATNGIIWGHLHTPYHMALILLATGIGIALRDIAIVPKKDATEAIHTLIRAGGEVKSGVAAFQTAQRWLLSVGWGASIILSGLIGSLHFAGPRAATKRYRLLLRCLIVFPIMIGIPFTDLEAEYTLAIYTAVAAFIAVAEYLCVHMDRLGFFRSENSIPSGSTGADSKPGFGEDFDDFDVSSDDIENIETGKGDENENTNGEQLDSNDPIAAELKSRLCKSHECTLVAVKARRRKRKAERHANP